MAHVIDIKRVEVGPKYLTARVSIDASAPLMTSEDLEGTTRVYRLLPRIIDHVCLGDHGETFKDVMGDTELAHLLEHVTVEILAQTDIAGDVTYGRTYAVEDDPRSFDVEFPCPDDALVIGALSSAAWILQWAYTGGGEPEPDVAATVHGLVNLIESLPEPPRPLPSVREYVVEGEEARAILEELGLTTRMSRSFRFRRGLQALCRRPRSSRTSTPTTSRTMTMPNSRRLTSSRRPFALANTPLR